MIVFRFTCPLHRTSYDDSMLDALANICMHGLCMHVNAIQQFNMLERSKHTINVSCLFASLVFIRVIECNVSLNDNVIYR